MERADSLYFAVSVIEGIELIKFSKRKKKRQKSQLPERTNCEKL